MQGVGRGESNGGKWADGDGLAATNLLPEANISVCLMDQPALPTFGLGLPC